MGPIRLMGQIGPIGLMGLIRRMRLIGLMGHIGPIGLIGPIGRMRLIGLMGQVGPIGLMGQIGPMRAMGCRDGFVASSRWSDCFIAMKQLLVHDEANKNTKDTKEAKASEDMNVI